MTMVSKVAVLGLAALVTASTLGAPAAQARDGGAIAAGVIGGLAAGALLGAALSDAHGAPPPAYGYARPAPVGYGYAPAPVARVYEYDEEVPVYRPRRRVVRTYEPAPVGYGYREGYREAGYGWRGEPAYGRGYGYGGGW